MERDTVSWTGIDEAEVASRKKNVTWVGVEPGSLLGSWPKSQRGKRWSTSRFLFHLCLARQGPRFRHQRACSRSTPVMTIIRARQKSRNARLLSVPGQRRGRPSRT